MCIRVPVLQRKQLAAVLEHEAQGLPIGGPAWRVADPAAGLGVAMGNGKSAVREAAGRVIGSNSEDGLAEFLEELAGEKTF